MEKTNFNPLVKDLSHHPLSERETIKVIFIRDLGYNLFTHLTRSFWKIENRDRLVAEFVFNFTFTCYDESQRYIHEVSIAAMELCEQLNINVLFFKDVEVIKIHNHDITAKFYS